MITSFADWRNEARRLLLAGVEPHAAHWQGNADLFGDQASAGETSGPVRTFNIPKELPELLASAARFRADDRWALLYRVLWRVVEGDRSAMLAGDIDGSELHRRIKAVRREAHHMHAFLRFRPCQHEGLDFIAWHEPDHEVLDLGAEHFITRMGRHRWLIATPAGAAHCDGEQVHYHQPCPPELRELARTDNDDAAGDLWKAYYHSTFNPARLNEKVMRSHMPTRFWRHLPEGPLISRMMSEARAGQQRLGQTASVGARNGKEVLIASDRAQPKRGLSTALQGCQACGIWRNATCAVAGEGPQQARIMLVGGQPGDLEDLAGRPFVGPAGQVLDHAFAKTGLERGSIYLTNAVKHFKWTAQGVGKRTGTRLHAPAEPAEIEACRFWLERELAEVRPRIIVALGRTALASLLNVNDPQRIDLADYGQQPLRHGDRWLLAAPHPAAVLRSSEDGEKYRADLIGALKQAKQLASAT
ncbi:UdgX family uracil-DNA binding protein [Pseudomonas sp. LRF_L74]|uniref:UdgX family uracil-DNA binding protein n=1 Tax=Pseudomonas sp. LRF_L74 TaxID=3369422 RepID=UPI003F5ED0C5